MKQSVLVEHRAQTPGRSGARGNWVRLGPQGAQGPCRQLSAQDLKGSAGVGGGPAPELREVTHSHTVSSGPRGGTPQLGFTGDKGAGLGVTQDGGDSAVERGLGTPITWAPFQRGAANSRLD